MIFQAEKRGIKIGEVEKAVPLLLHAYIGAKMISEIYKVDDAEISQAIYRHTVGAKNMTDLDKIFVVQKNSLLHPDTIDARNFLLLSKE